jgi:putative lipoprotein
VALKLSSLTRRRFACSVAAFAALTFASVSFADERPGVTISGELTYLQRIALQDNATAIVELIAEDAADSQPVVGEFRQDLKGAQVPISFTFNVEKERLATDQKYVVRGAINVDGQVRWLSEAVPVDLTQSTLNVGTLLLRPFEAPAPFGLTEPAAVQDVEWKISMLGDEPALEGLTLTLGTDGNFFGKACNSLRGSYTIEPGAISFSDAAATMMACSEQLMKQERILFDALESAAHFRLTDDGELTLQDTSGAALVTAKR